jgi:antitoxin HicB
VTPASSFLRSTETEHLLLIHHSGESPGRILRWSTDGGASIALALFQDQKQPGKQSTRPALSACGAGLMITAKMREFRPTHFDQRTFRTLPTEGADSEVLKFPQVRYLVHIEQDEDGFFVATCPALPGCISQGGTRAEATDNIREAMEGYLRSLRKHGEPVPPSIFEEVIEVPG